MVIALLRPIEAKGSLETVKRLSQRLNEIMTYSVNSGLIFANPVTGIRAVFKKPKKENMAAVQGLIGKPELAVIRSGIGPYFFSPPLAQCANGVTC